MEHPLVSIILTLYNGEKFIRQTIKNVIDQTYAHWELIVVNDASTDSSSEIVHSFTDPRIRIIDLPENVQVVMAHRIGDAEAKGKYIAALDKDDLWEQTKLEKQVTWMEAHSETGVCFTEVKIIDDNGRPAHAPQMERLFSVRNQNREKWLYDLLTTGNHLCHSSSLIRKDALDASGGQNILFRMTHDYELWVRLALKNEFYVIPEQLTMYRWFEKSGSNSEVNDVNLHRTLFEYAWCVGHTIMQMEPALFKTVFRDELRNKDAETDLEIRCEKALLLASDMLVMNCRVFAFEMFEELFRDPEAIRVLKEKYGFTQHDVYRMTGDLILYANGDLEEVTRLNNEVRRWKDAVNELKNSPSFRVTAPLRFVKNLFRGKR